MKVINRLAKPNLSNYRKGMEDFTMYFLSQTTRKFQLKSLISKPELEQLYYHMAARCAEYVPEDIMSSMQADVTEYFTPLASSDRIAKSGLTDVKCKFTKPAKARNKFSCIPMITRTVLSAQAITDHGYIVDEYPSQLIKSYVSSICDSMYYDLVEDEEFVYLQHTPRVLVELLKKHYPEHIVEDVPEIVQENLACPWH